MIIAFLLGNYLITSASVIDSTCGEAKVSTRAHHQGACAFM
jgi:hypothetical protein